MTKYFTDEQAFLEEPCQRRDSYKQRDLMLRFKSESWMVANWKSESTKKYPRHFTFVCDEWNVHTISINPNLTFTFHNHSINDLKKALVVRELTSKDKSEEVDEEGQKETKVSHQCALVYAGLVNPTGSDQIKYKLHQYDIREVLSEFGRITTLRAERAKKMKIINRKDLPTRLKDNFGKRIVQEFHDKLTYSKPNKKVEAEFHLEFNPEGKENVFSSSTRREEKRRSWRRTYYRDIFTLNLNVSPHWYKQMFLSGKWNFHGRIVFEYLKEYPNDFVVALVGHQDRSHAVSIRPALLDFKDKMIRWLKTDEERNKYLNGDYKPRRRMHKNPKTVEKTHKDGNESISDEVFNEET